MTSYNNKKFSVDINSEGAIKVNSGDSLSKYSAAIHNDFIHVYEFGRKDSAGAMQAITDIDKIFANETIFHVPTAIGKPVSNLPQLSNEEKKKLVIAALQADFDLNGEHLKVLSNVMEITGYVDDALTLVEIAGFITEGSLVASAASAISVSVLFFGPIGGIIALINANEAGERTYGMRAVAYTLTAWAYNEPQLAASNQIIRNMRQGFPTTPPQKINRYHDAWKKASNATLNHLTATTNSGKISKKSMQILLKALGNNDRRQLCLEFLKGFENQISHHMELRIWKSNYTILYPQ